jgi:hypothetical protein
LTTGIPYRAFLNVIIPSLPQADIDLVTRVPDFPITFSHHFPHCSHKQQVFGSLSSSGGVALTDLRRAICTDHIDDHFGFARAILTELEMQLAPPPPFSTPGSSRSRPMSARPASAGSGLSVTGTSLMRSAPVPASPAAPAFVTLAQFLNAHEIAAAATVSPEEFSICMERAWGARIRPPTLTTAEVAQFVTELRQHLQTRSPSEARALGLTLLHALQYARVSLSSTAVFW